MTRTLPESAVFEEVAEEAAGDAGDDHRVRLGMRLKPRRKIGGLADDCLLLGSMFADQVAHDDRAGGDANADMKVDTDVGLDGGHGPDQRQSRARRLLGITFMRMRVAEIGEHTVSHVAGDDPLVECDDLLDAGVIGRYHPPQVLGIEPNCEFRRADQIAAQDRQLPPLGIRSRHRLGGPGSGSAATDPFMPAIARNILRRCPRKTPRSLRSCSVKSGTTERSMAFSAKHWAYSLSPSEASHSAIPVMANPVPADATIART